MSTHAPHAHRKNDREDAGLEEVSQHVDRHPCFAGHFHLQPASDDQPDSKEEQDPPWSEDIGEKGRNKATHSKDCMSDGPKIKGG